MIKNKNGSYYFTDEEINKIKDMYLNDFMSPNKISDVFGCCESVIYRLLKKMNINMRHTSQRIKFDNTMFDIIDTEEKAYWIGFIWCDDCNCKRFRKKDGNPSYEIKISLMEEDKNHLEKLKEFFKASQEIKFYKHSSGYIRKSGESSGECRILFSNNYLGKVLEEKYGMIPNRSDCTKLINNIPKNLIKHFIRGVIDADGCLYSYNKHYKSTEKEYEKFAIGIHLTTCETLVDFIQNYLYNNNIVTSLLKKNKRHKNRDDNCVGITYNGNNNVINLMNWLYKDSNIYLDRKYNRYLQYKQILNK